MLRFITDINIEHNLIYPVMTAFTDQYSLPNIGFFLFFFVFFYLFFFFSTAKYINTE